MKEILVTGGAGYIGSHTCVRLIERGYMPIIVDNLINSDGSAIIAIEKITGFKPTFYNADVTKDISKVFEEHDVHGVIHFAALKAVGESVEKPLEYYENNLGSLINVIAHMRKFEVKNLVFSSSATVYGDSFTPPFTEDMTEKTASSATNPYGYTKIMCEQIVKDCSSAYGLSVAALRYFNPVNSHGSGLLPEKPVGKPNNLYPIVENAAAENGTLTVYGNDYPTPDGTCIRDYIHVEDLADGHICAIDYLEKNDGYITVNLGTGKGLSVLEIIYQYEKRHNVKINYRIGPRRAGDAAVSLADPSKAKEVFGWEAKKKAV